MVKCKSCGGEYERVLPGGIQYFHVCPPILMVRVERAGAWKDVPLSDLQATDAINVTRAGAPVKTLVSAIAPDDIRLGDRLVERPDKRDENVKIVGYDKAGCAQTELKSDGLGVELVVK